MIWHWFPFENVFLQYIQTCKVLTNGYNGNRFLDVPTLDCLQYNVFKKGMSKYLLFVKAPRIRSQLHTRVGECVGGGSNDQSNSTTETFILISSIYLVNFYSLPLAMPIPVSLPTAFQRMR